MNARRNSFEKEEFVVVVVVVVVRASRCVASVPAIDRYVYVQTVYRYIMYRTYENPQLRNDYQRMRHCSTRARARRIGRHPDRGSTGEEFRDVGTHRRKNREKSENR